MSKTANAVVLFLGVLLFAFTVVVVGQGAGCDPANCQGTSESGTSLSCNTQTKYKASLQTCVQKDQEETSKFTFNCDRSGTPAGSEVHCDECCCSYRDGDDDGTACKCRHEGNNGKGTHCIQKRS